MKESQPNMTQGPGAHEVFSGSTDNPVIEKIYRESASYFANIIRNMLPPKEGSYEVLDLGSYRGELIERIKTELEGEYSLRVIGMDKEESALNENDHVESKIVGDIAHVPLEDQSVDVGIMRYALQWNTPERQKQILMEMNRVCREFAIVQHAGADRDDSKVWQEKMHALVFGGVSKVSRDEGYFSSPAEIETWLTELGIPFQRLQDRIVDHISSVFIEKYKLTEYEAGEVIRILGDKDTIEQTTWIIGNKVQA